MRVPLVDLARQHSEVSVEIAEGLNTVYAETAFIQGPQVAQFEEEFAAFSGVKHCVGVGNGTDALELSLRALEIGPGDQVVVPANTFIASALAVLRAGASVVLADCDPVTYLIDTKGVEQALNPRVRAVMPVHLYGQMAALEELKTLVREIYIVEDAAQAQGATRHDRGIGQAGTVAGTSFYPGKNLGAYGDAGAVLTDDDALAGAVRRLGNWGSDKKYFHPDVGFNSRLDTVQAVVLRAKLSRLDKWNQQRAIAAQLYDDLLGGIERVVTPTTDEGNVHVWHLYVIRVPARDQILEHMRADGVGVGIHYPTPIHLHGAMADLGHQPGDFPVAEAVSNEILSLPLFPGITEPEQEYVVDSLKRVLAKVSRRA